MDLIKVQSQLELSLAQLSPSLFVVFVVFVVIVVFVVYVIVVVVNDVVVALLIVVDP